MCKKNQHFMLRYMLAVHPFINIIYYLSANKIKHYLEQAIISYSLKAIRPLRLALYEGQY